MEILDFVEPKVREDNTSNNLKWLLVVIVLFGFSIQIDSFFSEVQLWVSLSDFERSICPMGRPAPFYTNSENIYLIGFLGIIISMVFLKIRKWKMPNLFRQRLVLFSPVFLLFIQYNLGEFVLVDVVWRYF